MVKPSDAGEGDGGEREEEGHEGETATAVGNDESAGSSSVVVAAAVVERVPRLAVAEESLSSSAASSLSLEQTERDTSATDRSSSTPSAAAAAAAPGMMGTPLQGTSSTPRPLTFSSPHCDDVIQTLAEEFEVEETKL